MTVDWMRHWRVTVDLFKLFLQQRQIFAVCAPHCRRHQWGNPDREPEGVPDFSYVIRVLPSTFDSPVVRRLPPERAL